ncbi:MAG: nitroreductase family protein [Bacteroidales bacterium]|jgi:nitroreductase|nr:nitroreductase family protein [Bacteroidales bacterium]
MERENIKTLLNRRTIRKYSNKKIDQLTIDTLIDAGIRASNCGNMQLYSIILTEDEKNKEALCKLHFNQPMVKEAPLVMTICADLNRFHSWCIQRGTTIEYDNFLWLNIATIDATILTQSICNCAEELGLGICYLGTVNYMAKPIAELLDLPKYVVPVTTITIGYPDENPPITERLPNEAIVHREKYHNYSTKDIDKLYTDFENLPQSKNYCKESGKENLAKVFTESRYTGKDGRNFSRQYLDFVTKQGFMRNFSDKDE